MIYMKSREVFVVGFMADVLGTQMHVKDLLSGRYSEIDSLDLMDKAKFDLVSSLLILNSNWGYLETEYDKALETKEPNFLLLLAQQGRYLREIAEMVVDDEYVAEVNKNPSNQYIIQKIINQVGISFLHSIPPKQKENMHYVASVFAKSDVESTLRWACKLADPNDHEFFHQILNKEGVSDEIKYIIAIKTKDTSLLEYLSDDVQDLEIVSAIVENKNTPRHVIDKLKKSHYYYVQAAMALSGKNVVEIINELFERNPGLEDGSSEISQEEGEVLFNALVWASKNINNPECKDDAIYVANKIWRIHSAYPDSEHNPCNTSYFVSSNNKDVHLKLLSEKPDSSTLVEICSTTNNNEVALKAVELIEQWMSNPTEEELEEYEDWEIVGINADGASAIALFFNDNISKGVKDKLLKLKQKDLEFVLNNIDDSMEYQAGMPYKFYDQVVSKVKMKRFNENLKCNGNLYV